MGLCSHAETILTAPNPDETTLIQHNTDGEIIYELDGDRVYDLETRFEFTGNLISAVFRGKTGREHLVFADNNKQHGYVLVGSGYGDTSISFENLGSFTIRDSTAYYNVMQFAGNYENSTVVSFKNIAGNILIDNNMATDDVVGMVIRMRSLGYSKNACFYVDGLGGDFLLTNNKAGDAIIGFNGIGKSDIHFKNIDGKLVFSDNVTFRNNQLSGGVIKLYADFQSDLYTRGDDVFDLAFEKIKGGVLIDNNSSGGIGAALSMIFRYGNVDGTVRFQDIENGIYLTNNKSASYGGALAFFIDEGAGVSSPAMPSTAKVKFLNSSGGLFVTGNEAAGGAAFFLQNKMGDIEFSIQGISGGVDISSNISSTMAGGAFYMLSYERVSLDLNNINGNVTFTGNISHGGRGGFAYIGSKEYASFAISGVNGDFIVSGNKAEGGSGGAFSLLSNLETFFSISHINGEVQFLNNTASGNGGAIYLGGNDVNLLLSADGGDIIFKGNTHQGGDANSIYLDGTGNSQFRAAEGRSIYFYDPIHMNMDDTYLTEINKPDGAKTYTGQVVFSGEDFDFDDYTNLTSYIQGDTIVYDGEFLITDNAVYGALDIDPLGVDPTTYSARSFTVEAGTLEFARNGTLIAEYVTMHPGSLLRVEYGGTIIADHVDFSRGVLFDIMPFVDNYNCGLQIIQANALTLDQNLRLYDKLDLYTHPRWTTEQRYLVLSLNEDILNVTSGDFADILSYTFDTNILSSPYIYDGSWHMEWVDTSGDGIEDELYAVWTPADGQVPPIDPPDPVDPGPEPEPGPGPEEPGPDPGPGITEVHPELDGTNVLNSLWSTISNVQTLKNTALGQIGLRRSHIGPENNYWATGIAEFSHHNTVRGRNGYEYTGWGYAVGADHALDDNTLLGVAFGNLYGTNKSKNYNGEIKQKTYIGMIYGAWDKELDKKNTLRIQGDASYGHVDNTLKTAYSDGDRSRGTWDNNVFHLYLEGAWDIDLGEDWVLTPYVAVEFAEAKEKSFTETGDKIRSFGPAQIRNLTLPVGVGVSKLLKFENGMKWINGITLSYLPDVYRKNPEAEVVRLSNGFEWTAVGSKPSRNAGQASWQSRLILNDHWSVFASYTFEARSHAMYHGCNAGVSCSF